MIVTTAAWLSAAWALDGRDGFLLPGASTLEAGHGRVGAAAGAIVVAGLFADTRTAFGFGGTGAVGITDRLAVIGAFGTFRTRTTVQRSAPDIATGQWSIVSLRGNVVQREEVNVGLLLTHAGFWDRPFTGSLGLGVAVDAGSERVRFDLSVPNAAALRAVTVDGEYGLHVRPLTLGVEAGVTFFVGEHHRFRLGIPGFTWGIHGDRWYFDLSASTLLLFNGAALQVGVRF